jgi:hypothetical protein
MLYVFGGTDGQYHYNDTWCFDPRVQRWTELQCIGFIPAPREGHSVAVVDDVIYIFGGRGVDGKDLGDLTGFRISSEYSICSEHVQILYLLLDKRWYMFQNMGPAPSGRSGHAMASVGSRVYVLGGESYTSARPDDPTTFHVLDTSAPMILSSNTLLNLLQSTSNTLMRHPHALEIKVESLLLAQISHPARLISPLLRVAQVPPHLRMKWIPRK